MAIVYFTTQLERLVEAPSIDAEGGTLDEVLSAVFWEHPALKGYILDDQGAIRRHVAVFIDGEQARDRLRLSDPVGAESQVHVFQALSGG